VITLASASDLLARRFGGRIMAGKHFEGGECCVLELASALRGRPWTDDPYEVGTWDLRPLNDCEVDDATRTAGMLPVLVAYDGCRRWPPKRQAAVASRLAVLTVRRLVAELPGLPPEIARRCRSAETVREARDGAAAAHAAAAHAAAAALGAADAADAAAAAFGAAAAALRDADAAAAAFGADAVAAQQAFRAAAAAFCAAGAPAAIADARAAGADPGKRVFAAACELSLEAAAWSPKEDSHATT